jgi:pyruvate,water dikinase
MSAEAVDLQYFGDMPGIPSYESEARDFDVDPAFEEKAGAWLMHEVLGATGLPEYDQDRAEVLQIRRSRPDLSTLSDQELRERITSFDDILRPLFKRHIEASLKCGVGLGGVAQFAEAIGKPELALVLVGGLGDIDSAIPSHRIWELSRAAQDPAVAELFDDGISGLHERLRTSDRPAVQDFFAQLESFIDEWDFRGPAEWEIRAKTWRQSPEIVLGAIDKMRPLGDADGPEEKNRQRAAEREAATAAIREAIAADPEAAGQFEAVLNGAAMWMRGRERGRTTAAMAMHEIRLPAVELGRRAAEAGHLRSAELVFMLFAEELDAFVADPASFAEVLEEREKSYLELFDLHPPFVVAGSVPDLSTWKRRDAAGAAALTAGAEIQGVSGCNGTVRGRARVLTTPDDPSALLPGEILVAPITDPSWTPLFVSAGAVVVDVGAPFSHAAIVSRELGIPCVVSATDATTRIPDGALVEVDGTSGRVTVLEVAARTEDLEELSA